MKSLESFMDVAPEASAITEAQSLTPEAGQPLDSQPFASPDQSKPPLDSFKYVAVEVACRTVRAVAGTLAASLVLSMGAARKGVDTAIFGVAAFLLAGSTIGASGGLIAAGATMTLSCAYGAYKNAPEARRVAKEAFHAPLPFGPK
jgi:hypothetical protein